MSMASSQSQHSQLSTDTVSSMSGSYIAPGTEEEEEEEGDMLPSPAAASATASDGEVGTGGCWWSAGWIPSPWDVTASPKPLALDFFFFLPSIFPTFLLQSTPVESPDLNFVSISAEERDAEVTITIP